MDFDEADAIEALEFALKAFNKHDRAELEECKFGERVFTHRLGVYLQNFFNPKEGFELIKVDCEYNRRGKDDPKQAFGLHMNEELKKLIFQARDLIVDSELYPDDFKKMAFRLIKAEGKYVDPEKLQEFIVANCSTGREKKLFARSVQLKSD